MEKQEMSSFEVSTQDADTLTELGKKPWEITPLLGAKFQIGGEYFKVGILEHGKIITFLCEKPANGGEPAMAKSFDFIKQTKEVQTDNCDEAFVANFCEAMRGNR